MLLSTSRGSRFNCTQGRSLLSVNVIPGNPTALFWPPQKLHEHGNRHSSHPCKQTTHTPEMKINVFNMIIEVNENITENYNIHAYYKYIKLYTYELWKETQMCTSFRVIEL